jgi:hypothetical protein
VLWLFLLQIFCRKRRESSQLLYFYDESTVREIAKKSGMEHLLPDLGLEEEVLTMNTPVPATINGVEICFDGELVNLTSLWKAAGGVERNKPVKWLTNEGAKDFISSLAKEFKSQESDLLKITKGRYGGTFGHWQIALAYAKYLSPEFHIAANKIIKRYIEEEIDPSKAIDRAVNRYRRMGMTEAQIEARLKGTVTRNGLTTTVARVLDDPGQRDYSRFTNQMYSLLFGKDAKQLSKERGVKIARDGMTETELRVVDACEALLKDRLAAEGYVDRKELAQAVKAIAGPFGMVLQHREAA